MQRKLYFFLFLAGITFIFSSCDVTTQTNDLPPVSPGSGDILRSDKNDLFATAGTCVICHQNNLDEAGNDVSNGEYWRSTMMANAAVDPYYLAGVSINVARYPEYSAAIETKCNTCHTPMAHYSDAAKGKQGSLFGANGYLNMEHPLNILALDGVSCTTCHQVQNEGLGEFTSFSGGGVFDIQSPMGNRVLFGPFVPQQAGQNIMSSVSGFIPQQGIHLGESEICATCHNLYTHYVTEDGTFGEDWFPEQTPYSEWLNSDYATRSTCQDCHMPPAEGAVVLANLGPAIMRSPYSKHNFVGGNAYMLELLKTFGDELGVQASTEHFDATLDRTLTQLQSQTATISISDLAKVERAISFNVTTNIMTGHKFPSGYPSRRSWLHVTVKDSSGKIIFESGAVSNNGTISGNDNDADTLAFEPHYDQITSSEQVQIYETIMQDVYGNLTTVLLSASAYTKDNRLLPTGFDKTAVDTDIVPKGKAFSDDDFISGADTVGYRVDTGDYSGPFMVEVSLLYQSIAFRWAQDSSTYDTEPAQVFNAYYSTLPNLPILVATQSIQSK